MQAKIAHRIPGRTRFTTPYRFSTEETICLSAGIQQLSGVISCKIHSNSGSIIIEYQEKKLPQICRYLLRLPRKNILQIDSENLPNVYHDTTELFDIIKESIEKFIFYRFIVPFPLRTFFTIKRAIGFIKRAIQSLKEQRKLTVEVLDTVAISISILSREFGNAAIIMAMLNLGERLEEWTFKRSKLDLENSLSFNIEKVFVVDRWNQRKQIPLHEVVIGDYVEILMGNTIPVDGKVVSGVGMVNESSFTGEPLAVKKEIGNTVFAGTTLEEGSLVVQTTHRFDQSRIHSIIKQITESELNKSKIQKRSETLADSLVKYSFMGSIITFLLTKNLMKAKAFLMVDFSCALKLTIPIATMSAMRQAADMEVLVKGGKYLENLATADTIIFDKTGTLTTADPKVEKVIPLSRFDRAECLKLAACLEEHFPHPIAKAVVRKAEEEKILHKEMHTEPEYILAHGIASTVDGKRTLIGSEHFIIQDEGIVITEEQKDIIHREKQKYSLLYLTYDNQLIAILCISDPIREDAKETIGQLIDLGFENIVMLTGDHENAAYHTAQTLGLSDYRSQVLPEEKADFVRSMKKDGHTVIMVGDGMNDTIALSEADVGISIYHGADIAREVADISIGFDSLVPLIQTIKVAKALKRRIDKDYRIIIGGNSLFILLGVTGVITSTTSAFFHNTLTVSTILDNMRSYPLKENIKVL